MSIKERMNPYASSRIGNPAIFESQPPAAPVQPVAEEQKLMQMLDALVQKYSDKLYEGVSPNVASAFELDAVTIKQTIEFLYTTPPAQPATEESSETQTASAYVKTYHGGKPWANKRNHNGH